LRAQLASVMRCRIIALNAESWTWRSSTRRVSAYSESWKSALQLAQIALVVRRALLPRELLARPADREGRGKPRRRERDQQRADDGDQGGERGPLCGRHRGRLERKGPNNEKRHHPQRGEMPQFLKPSWLSGRARAGGAAVLPSVQPFPGARKSARAFRPTYPQLPEPDLLQLPELVREVPNSAPDPRSGRPSSSPAPGEHRAVRGAS
jgi:hypothetical protein